VTKSRLEVDCDQSAKEQIEQGNEDVDQAEIPQSLGEYTNVHHEAKGLSSDAQGDNEMLRDIA
jgi:hypothetical protein